MKKKEEREKGATEGRKREFKKKKRRGKLEK